MEKIHSNFTYKMMSLELYITIQKKLTPLDSSDGCWILSNIKKVNWLLGIISSRETLLPYSIITVIQIHDTPASWVACVVLKQITTDEKDQRI